ncbi:hypothetical protein LWI29_015656 [Acer saccharum]|uniref:Uncharacterized protein n=1 Tax=Acer saccharum TaxID=4024 RepID=A0AA39T3D5_ACESA|nr:hypothetical protein LWI29_015656 [Acer saccharum]
MIVVVGLIIFFFIYLHVKFNNRPQGQHDGHRRYNDLSNHRYQDHHTRPSTSSAPSTRSSTTHATLTPVHQSAKPASPPKREVSRHKHHSKEVDYLSNMAYDGRDTFSRPSTTHAPSTSVRKPVSWPEDYARQNSSARAIDGRTRLPVK